MSSLSDFKITDAAVARSGVGAAPDKLTGTAAENKAVFDRLVKEVVKERYNEMLDALETDISDYLGETEAERRAAEERRQANERERVADESARVASEEKREGVTVSARTLAPGSAATAEKAVDPQTGDIVIRFGIPRGRDGTGTVNSVNGVAPDADRDVALRASDVGAIPAPASAAEDEVLTYRSGAWVAAEASGGLLPQALVTTNAGARVTATLGAITVGPVTADEDGLATLELPDYGAWTVTAANDSYTSGTVLDVDSVMRYEITLYPRLPDGYTELEYIGLTGKQYIDTGISGLTEFMKIQTKVRLSSGGFIFGADTGSAASADCNTTKYNSLKFDSNSSFLEMGTLEWYPISGSSKMSVNTDYVFDANIEGNQMSYTLNGITYTSTGKSYGIGWPDRPIYVGALNRSAGTMYYFSGRIYNLSLSTAERPVVNFIPARRDSDSVVGMYDMVRNRFFTNAGSGSFTAGPEV